MAQTAGIIRGRLVSLNIDGTVIDNQLDSSFELTRDVDEITTKQSTGDAKEYDYGRYTGTGSANFRLAFDATEGLTQSVADLKAGTIVPGLWTTGTAANATYAASLLVSSVSVNFPSEGHADVSMSYQMTGEFTESTTA